MGEPYPYERLTRDAARWGTTQVVYDDNGGPGVIPGELPPELGTMPFELVEAVVFVETGGTWDPTTKTATGNPAGPYAIGLGQLVPGASQEIAWYEQLSGQKVTADMLYDPAVNLRLTAFGLAGRMSANQARVKDAKARDNWLLAATGYFGCPPDENGDLDPDCGDVLGTNAETYAARAAGYIRDTYGQDKLDEITDIPGFDPGGLVGDAVDKATGAGADIVRGVLSGLLGAVGAVLPRVGVAVAGIALLALGVYVAARAG